MLSNALRSISGTKNISPLSGDIIKTLIYFNLFDFPLTLKDLHRNSSVRNATSADISEELKMLLSSGYIGKEREYYYLNSTSGIKKREEGTILADQLIAKGRDMSVLIAAFPYVRGIFLSGSLSKGYADKESDVDYFIVTEPGRLWLCRTLLILYKKIFLFNSRKYFCLNYFVDSDHLEISDKNIFTSKELLYLLPVYNKDIYDKLMAANSWIKQYLPNAAPSQENILPVNKSFVRSSLEKILKGKGGNMLDNLCMKITEFFWRKKYKIQDHEDGLRIRCKKHVSKLHPRNFQVRILEGLNQGILEFEKKYNVSLNHD